MIPLKSTLCSKNVRKTGIVLTCISIFLQAATLIALIIMYALSSRDGGYWGWYDPGLLDYHWFYGQQFRNVLGIGLFFLAADIVLYILLIFGLSKRKLAPLTVWLCFSMIEFILVQTPLLVISFLWTINANPGIGILSLAGQIAVAVYMFYHASVVYSVRTEILDKKIPNNPNTTYAHYTANAIPPNSTNIPSVQLGVVGVPQYTIATQPVIVPAGPSTVNHGNPPNAPFDQKQQPPAYSY